MELGTIELGIGETLHAGLDEEYDPKADEVGLKQLLQIMNYSKVFSIGSADSGYAEFTKFLMTSSSVATNQSLKLQNLSA
jgi:hypothetical protein